MSAVQRYRKILSALLPAGANGIESRVDFHIECSQYRIKELDEKEWPDWNSGHPDENSLEEQQLLALPAYFRFEKRKEKWSVGKWSPLVEATFGELGGSALEPVDLIKPTPEESTQP